MSTPMRHDRMDTVAAMAKQQQTLGASIRSYRSARGMNRPTLAQRVGVDPQTIGRWERDERVPHPQHLLRLAEVLGVDAEALGYEIPVAAGGEAPAWAVQQFEQLQAQLNEIQLLLERIERRGA